MHCKPLLILAFVCLLPDEGQWLPTQVRNMDWDALQQRGMKLSRDEFWHPEQGGVLSATVQINGCTASFCSPDGLMVTNHHCGFDAVSQLSTVERNHLRDGYAAPDRDGELPSPGMVALVLKRIEDVTAQFHAEQAKAQNDLDRHDKTERLRRKLIVEAQQKEPGTECSIASFLEGKEYHLYYRTRLTDVRLVYAPPRAIGEYGGEVDNWEWPRHTGDFTFFRAYAAPDGTPRAHDPANVPFKPQHWLKVARDGVRENDLAIIMGYPGNTQRYKSSRAVTTRLGYIYPKRDEWLTAVLAVLEKASAGSEQKALQYAASIKRLANVQKNAKGMVFGLQQNAVVARKLREEAAFGEWLEQDPARRQRWGGVLGELLALDEAEDKTIQRDLAVGFCVNLLGAGAPLLAVLIEACQTAQTAENGALPPQLVEALGTARFDADMGLVQTPVLAIVLDELRSLPTGQTLLGTEVLQPDGEAAAMVGALLAASKMTDPAARRELFAGGKAAIDQSQDPMIVLARGLAAEKSSYQRRMRELSGRMLLVGRQWIEAQEAFRGKSFYPDANSTLRVSIAQVKGYKPRDGVFYTPHTTVDGLLRKNTGAEPFAAPAALVEASKQREKSKFWDAQLGDVPVCFLTDGDTTGGNSGSPVINGSGELIGLNFDRVFENVAGDFGWNPERSRNVCCDIRYVLWVVESVMPSPGLLAELLP